MQIAQMATSQLKDEENIRNWLIGKIAIKINEQSDDINPTLPFSFYGLDSVAAIGMSGELESWLQCKLPPTLIWDYPTIDLLAAHLAKE